MLDEIDRVNHVYIDDFGGNKLKVKTYELIEQEDQ